VTDHQRSRVWVSEALIIIFLLLLPLLFWWKLWTPEVANRSVIPEGDFGGQYYPLQLFASRELASGHLPAWDSYINAGQPGLADIQTGFFYPLNLLSALVLAVLGLSFSLQTLTAQVILHFALASLFTYLFVRHLALRVGARLPAARLAGVVAALAFTYSGYLTSFPVQQLTILETAVWLPLILFFLDRAFDSPRPLAQVILAGVSLACALLAGHPQTAMYIVYATLAYGLFRAHRSGLHFHVGRLLGLGQVLVLGVGLAAVQLVPTLVFIARSTRAGLGYDSVAWGFPLIEVTHLLYPGYFGGSPQYVGLVPPILAVGALLIKPARRQIVFWMALALLAFLLAFGGHTFLYSAAYLLAPGFGAVRDQERIIYLFSFAVSVLAGYGSLLLVQPVPRVVRRGFQRFVRAVGWALAAFAALTALWYVGYLQGQQQNVQVNLFEGVLRHHALLLLILGGTVVLLALRMSGRVKRRWLAALVPSLIWLNLFTINWQYNQSAPVEGGLFPVTGLVRFLKEQPNLFRISSSGLLPGGASAGIVYELQDITANTPLHLQAFQQFEDQVGSWRMWQLLNVKYVLSQQNLDGPGLQRVYEEGDVKVYRMSDPLPRAWVVHQGVVASDEQALELLNAEQWDPRATAVLPPGNDLSGVAGKGNAEPVPQVVEARPGHLVLDLSLSDDGLLVVSEPFYPGWQARVDGKRASISRVDYVLQGIMVQAGNHRVELDYHLSPLPGIASLAMLLGCGVALVFWKLRA
jgi:hypothetical protein